MSLPKSASNSRYIWVTGLTLSGCFAFLFTFRNSAEAIKLRIPAILSTNTSTLKAQVTIQSAKTVADPNAGNFQWIPYVLTGGFVGVAGFLAKQLADAKDAVISAKDTEIKRLQSVREDSEKLKDKEIQNVRDEYKTRITNLEHDNERIKKQLQETTDFRSLFDALISDLHKQGITSETDLSLRKILDAFNELKNYEQEVEPLHRNAGGWIKNRKEVWLKEMIQYAEDKYPQELKNNKDGFIKDISECLEWLYDSTFYNISHKFSQYLPKRSIDSPSPYRACFKYLKQKNDIGELKYEEADFFNKYLDELIGLL
jgi:hypothetical protein